MHDRGTFAEARSGKSVGVAYLLLVVGGPFGLHHFYLGKIGMGLLYLLTFGLFFLGVLVDIATLPAQIRRVNAESRLGLR